MPLARYQIRNEYSLADPELYRAADKDDPEALLEGVAMAGLVGVLRQLGDLAQFAAEIFHDLHEEVMVTAARGHGLMARVQQLEAEVPSLEKDFLSQTHHSSFFSNGGTGWHPNLRSEQNLITRGDLPRFIMDSYEECRGPPRLFLLDKFDVAGAGACLKRYTDPSFFKVESASPGTATVEVHREKRIRKVKKKAARLRNGETPELVPTHAKLHQLFLEERIENAYSDPARLVKLKKRQLNGSAVEAKSGKSYMEKFVETPSPDHKMICETSVIPLPVKSMSEETSETGIKILEISTVSPVKRSLGNDSTCSSPNGQESELKPSSEMEGETDEDLVKVHEQMPAGVTNELSPNHIKAPDETELAVDGQKNLEASLDGYHSDDVTSEVDNYLDALTTMESETEDNECRPKNNLKIQKLTDSDGKEVHQLQAQFLDSQSFGDSSTSDEISSLKQDRNVEHTELEARLSDSRSIGTSSTLEENSSFKRVASEERMELQAQFSDCQSVGNSSALDENSVFKKDIPCFSHSDSLGIVENIQSESILLPSTKYGKYAIEDAPSNHLPEIVGSQKADCSNFVMLDDTHFQKEEISNSGQAPSSSCLMNSGDRLLCSDLGASSPVILHIGTQLVETTSDTVELHSSLADDEGRKCLVESIAAVPDALSEVKDDTCSAVSSEKCPLNKVDDDDLCVHSDHPLQISSDSELPPVIVPAGTQLVETSSDPLELHSCLADDEDRKCLVEPITDVPDALLVMKDDTCPAVSFEKYPLNNLDDGDPYVHSDASLQISNNLNLAPEEEGSDRSEFKVLQAEFPNESCAAILVCREISSPGEQPIYPFKEEVDLYSGTTLPLDGPEVQDSKAEDCVIATELKLEDSSPAVETPPASSLTREQFSYLTHDCPHDEPDSSGVEVLYSDQPSNFEEISRMERGDEKSESTCSVEAVEDDDHPKHPFSPGYVEQENHVMVNVVLTENFHSEDQAVSAAPVIGAENSASVVSCPDSDQISSSSMNLANLQEPFPSSSDSNQSEMESNEVESTEIFGDFNAEKSKNQLEPSSYIISSDIVSSPMKAPRNLEESLSTFRDPLEKEMEVNEAVARESLTELEAQKGVDQPEVASTDVRSSLNRSLSCDLSDSETSSGIQDLSLKERIQHSSANDVTMVPEFSEIGTQESESISPCQNDSLSSPSYNQLESETPSEQLLQSQAGQQDVESLLRVEENSASEKLQSEDMQLSNQLEQERSSHVASELALEIHLDQPSSSESLLLSAGQEIKPTQHVMDPLKPLFSDPFPKATEINSEEMPPMPPLPPMQWRMGKVQNASHASHREVIDVSQASFQPIRAIRTDEKAQFGLLTSDRETLQYQNPFSPVMSVEGDKIQYTSGFSVGVSGHPVAIPLQFPVMVNEANGQYNYLVLERSQIQNPFLTLPVVSTGRPPHGYVVASEGEMVQYSNPCPPMPPVECAVSGYDPVSLQGKLTQPPSKLKADTSLDVETLQNSLSNLEGQQKDPSVTPTPPPRMEIVQPNHNLLPSESNLEGEPKDLSVTPMPPPSMEILQLNQTLLSSEGEMASSMDTSALTPDFECEKPNGKPKNKLPRPRSPLIDAVAAHDKSKMRKVTQRVRPEIAPEADERDSLLEQIRTKSFSLKPAVATRPNIQGPKTNLKFAAILEKANAIRQALAGSDEDDDADSWSDS